VPDNAGSFFAIYFMMTGVHGIHVLVGIGVLIWMWRRNERGEFSAKYFTPIDLAALYWHWSTWCGSTCSLPSST